MTFKPGRQKFGKGRKAIGQRNKTEELFENTYLLPAVRDGRCLWYRYEAMTFLLAPGLRYTPDFMAMADDGVIEFFEVKGSFLLDGTGRAKFLTASELFPFAFFRCRWLGRKRGWEVTSPTGEISRVLPASLAAGARPAPESARSEDAGCGEPPRTDATA